MHFYQSMHVCVEDVFPLLILLLVLLNTGFSKSMDFFVCCAHIAVTFDGLSWPNRRSTHSYQAKIIKSCLWPFEIVSLDKLLVSVGLCCLFPYFCFATFAHGCDFLIILLMYNCSLKKKKTSISHCMEIATIPFQLDVPESSGRVGPSQDKGKSILDISDDDGLDKKAGSSEVGAPDIEQLIKGKTFSR